MKSKKIILGAALTGVLALSACGSMGTVATSKVGNVSESELNKELKDQFGQKVLYYTMAKKALLDQFKVTDSEAEEKVKEMKKQMGDNFKQSLEQMGIKDESVLKEQMKVQVAIQKGIKESITEKDLKEHYKPEIKASHILVKDEKLAKEIKDKLKNGEDFASLAKEYSEDPGSKSKGGDLGYFGPGVMDKNFEEAAYKLEKDKVSDPIKSSFGYHIIKLTDKKELKPFKEMKDEIRKKLETERSQDQSGVWNQQVVEKALKKAEIKVKDKDLEGTFKNIQ
ncbi:peptidylprolyl isomerase [Bacillus cereus]|uniref:peptidylprolyl isomerase n=1 Tax=Bacillus cereus TaxID=1396 RepID=UPI000B4B6624|nr:peptidylprolyl isomerase [Bacillus cereus]